VKQNLALKDKKKKKNKINKTKINGIFKNTRSADEN
jgi:hypothetical protein